MIQWYCDIFNPKYHLLACYDSFYTTTWYSIFERVEQLLQTMPCGWRRWSVYLISNFIIICHDDEFDTYRNQKGVTCVITKQVGIERIKIFTYNKFFCPEYVIRPWYFNKLQNEYKTNYNFHNISKWFTACHKPRINIYYTSNIFTDTSRKNLYAFVTSSGKTVVAKNVLVNT